MSVAPFLNDNVFGPQDIQAMSTALEDVCKILDLSDGAKSERELLAQNILALAHSGRTQRRASPRPHAEDDRLWPKRMAGRARSRRSMRSALRLEQMQPGRI